ncbi:hypothetical protein [Listeria phage List-36]|nr:hypothetical protein HH35_gp044 [Listeria phage List-36]AIA64213.1 hypothetical protein [Listeria phage List-36]QIG60881.1 hypothetical protein vBLinoVEfB7_138 [Listeria phage vB_Lino_VEfB7]
MKVGEKVVIKGEVVHINGSLVKVETKNSSFWVNKEDLKKDKSSGK